MQDAEVDALIPLLYEELHRRAQRMARAHRGSVAPTSLVHEAFEKLARHDPSRWQSPTHFRAVASRAMRQVLVDRARRRGADKRGGGLVRVSLTGLDADNQETDLVDLAHALDRLADARPRASRVAELKVLGGMEVTEIAEWMDISPSTVKRDWRVARAFLLTLLEGQGVEG